MSLLKYILQEKKSISNSELKLGIRVEMEHTSNREKAKKIALDHLKEDSKYYTKLYKAGLIDEPEVLNTIKVK